MAHSSWCRTQTQLRGRTKWAVQFSWVSENRDCFCSGPSSLPITPSVCLRYKDDAPFNRAAFGGYFVHASGSSSDTLKVKNHFGSAFCRPFRVRSPPARPKLDPNRSLTAYNYYGCRVEISARSTDENRANVRTDKSCNRPHRGVL